MEDLKKCPQCGRMIKTAAKKCRFCGKWLEEENLHNSASATPHKEDNDLEKYGFAINTGKDISLQEALLEPTKLAFKNIGWLILTALLYSVTCWIPYLNIGTTIAMQNLPSALARGEKISPLFIFEAKYRKYMGEYLTMSGNYILILIASIPFLGIPMLIIYYGWSFSSLLLVDKEVSVSEAFTLSTKLTYGYKLKMFLAETIVEIALVILCVITAITIIIPIFLAMFYLYVWRPALTAVFYKHLVVDKE